LQVETQMLVPVLLLMDPYLEMLIHSHNFAPAWVAAFQDIPLLFDWVPLDLPENIIF
jgi:hypothetical protein